MLYRGLRSQIRELLEKRGETQDDLAKGLGLSPGRISHLLSQEMRIQPETVRRVADYFKVPPTYFDHYVRMMLPEVAVSVPGLIQIGREVLEAKDSKTLRKVIEKRIA